MKRFGQSSYSELKIKSLLDDSYNVELAVCVEDMDVEDMSVVVQLKRKLITGKPPRVKGPSAIGSARGQEADSPIIFRCNVVHPKNKYSMERVRYKKGDDVMVVFSDRAKDYLVKTAHEVNIDPVYARSHSISDAFVLLAFQNDEGEPRATYVPENEAAIPMRKPYYEAGFTVDQNGNKIWWGGELGWGRADDYYHYVARKDTPGYRARIYSTPEGDHVIHPAYGRHVYLQEGARWNILFAQPVANSYNPHRHWGMPGAITGAPLEEYHFVEIKHWSLEHWVDNGTHVNSTNENAQGTGGVYDPSTGQTTMAGASGNPENTEPSQNDCKTTDAPSDQPQDERGGVDLSVMFEGLEGKGDGIFDSLKKMASSLFKVGK